MRANSLNNFLTFMRNEEPDLVAPTPAGTVIVKTNRLTGQVVYLSSKAIHHRARPAKKLSLAKDGTKLRMDRTKLDLRSAGK